MNPYSKEALKKAMQQYRLNFDQAVEFQMKTYFHNYTPEQALRSMGLLR